MTTKLQLNIKHITLSIFASAVVSFSVAAAPASDTMFASAPGEYKRPSISTNDYRLTTDFSKTETAVRFIEFSGIDKNLSLLLLHDVKTENQVTEAISRIGFEKVKSKVVVAIKKAQLAHKSDWSAMLAGVYLNYFESSELQSILTEKESSPFFTKMIELQTAISKDVDTKGKRIFERARSQVMKTLKAELAV